MILRVTVTALACIVGIASAQLAKDSGNYLALGDSLAFGYNPSIQPPELSKYVGYPLVLSTILNLPLTNASCPGESSGTFTGTSTTYYPGFDCATMRSNSQLFVNYGNATSQLNYAVQWLQVNPSPRLVTLNIGGNDLALLQVQCTVATPTDPTKIAKCEGDGLPATLGTFGNNLAGILGQIRATGYSGPLVVLNYFAFNYKDSLQVGAFTALNGTISTVAALFGAKVADSFTAFKLASARFKGDVCSTGLLLKLPNGTCDTHPSLAGQALLAGTVLAAK